MFHGQTKIKPEKIRFYYNIAQAATRAIKTGAKYILSLGTFIAINTNSPIKKMGIAPHAGGIGKLHTAISSIKKMPVASATVLLVFGVSCQANTVKTHIAKAPRNIQILLFALWSKQKNNTMAAI